MRQVGGIFVLAAIGVILADLVANPTGTSTLFCHITNIWGTSINGMLGQQYQSADCSKVANPPAKGPTPPASQKKPAPGSVPAKKQPCTKCCFLFCICCPSWL